MSLFTREKRNQNWYAHCFFELNCYLIKIQEPTFCCLHAGNNKVQPQVETASGSCDCVVGFLGHSSYQGKHTSSSYSFLGFEHILNLDVDLSSI